MDMMSRILLELGMEMYTTSEFFQNFKPICVRISATFRTTYVF